MRTKYMTDLECACIPTKIEGRDGYLVGFKIPYLFLFPPTKLVQSRSPDLAIFLKVPDQLIPQSVGVTPLQVRAGMSWSSTAGRLEQNSLPAASLCSFARS